MVRKIFRAIGIILASLLVLALVLPLLIPVPPPPGVRPAAELADADSQFIEINGLTVHVKTYGQPGGRVFVLLHGFGASLYSWQPIVDSLSQLGQVIAYDRPAFGLTERPLEWEGQNPYGPDAQVDLLIGLMDHFGVKQAIWVGNSAGGAVSMQAALSHPERVSALVLVDPAVYGSGRSNPAMRWLMQTPQARNLGPLLVREIQKSGPKMIETAWHDPSRISAQTLQLYKKPLQAENWDRALWEFSLAGRDLNLDEQLDRLTLSVLVITGDDDRIIPTENSIRLAGELPNARLEVIEAAGHVPHEEQPAAFMDALKAFLNDMSF